MIPKRLGEYLRECRESQAMTLRMAAKRSGVSNPYISQIERGKSCSPSPVILAALAKAYSVKYGDVMAAAGYDPVNESDGDETNAIVRGSIIPRWAISTLTLQEQRHAFMFIKYLIYLRTKVD